MWQTLKISLIFRGGNKSGRNYSPCICAFFFISFKVKFILNAQTSSYMPTQFTLTLSISRLASLWMEKKKCKETQIWSSTKVLNRNLIIVLCLVLLLLFLKHTFYISEAFSPWNLFQDAGDFPLTQVQTSGLSPPHPPSVCLHRSYPVILLNISDNGRFHLSELWL